MKVFLAVSLLGILWFAEAGVLTTSTWAVLVAGSKGIWNYRHQADICHAYHTLINKGVHPDKIIVMMYDDIANNLDNKTPGKIFNRPDGPDVYEGVKIDYRGDDVTVNNFENVLLGKKDALKGIGTGRVLESGPNDLVFVNFADHGGEHVLAFPNELLSADRLSKIFEGMRQRKKYGKMVLFIEACEAGSMFDSRLGHYDNILASTASAPDESSWSWYCDDENLNCLGDLYSITWMERLDTLSISETLFENYDAVRTETLQKSHVNLYGDYRLGFLEFGKYNSNNTLAATGEEENRSQDSGVNSRDVPLYVAQKQVEKASPVDLQEKKMKLEKLVKGREFADELVSSILMRFANGDQHLKTELEHKRYTPKDDDMFDCYNTLITSFEKNCYKVAKHTYFLKHLYKFANICTRGLNESDAQKAIRVTCSQQNAVFELII